MGVVTYVRRSGRRGTGERRAEPSGSESSCAATAPDAASPSCQLTHRKAPKIADHISNLPDGVLQHILSFLPAQDVVRTCVLAKSWCHLWKSTTALRFVCGGLKEPKSMEEIQAFVGHLLRLRLRISGGTPLDTCEFRLVGDAYAVDAMTDHINIWIRIAVQCNVRVLKLMCWGIRPMDEQPVFVSQYLKKLHLAGLRDDEVPSGLLDLSCCPNLEELKVVECLFVDVSLISSQSLKHLTIQNCSFASDSHMPIRAPNLVSLWLEVYNGRIPSLKIMPSLVSAFVKTSSVCTIDDSDDNDNDESHDDDNESDDDDNESDDDDDESNDDDKDSQSILLQGLSDVRNLALISCFAKTIIFGKDLKFLSGFNKLKSLLLDEHWCEPPDFNALACLLKLSPVLENLTLQLYSEGPEHKVEIKLSCKPLEMSAAISQHLKTIKIKCEVYDERINNVLMFLSKKLNIWFQFGG